MDFKLSKEHELIKRTAFEFAKNEVYPYAKMMDEQKFIPREILKKAAELNMLGLAVPREYGGAGVDTIGFGLVLGEISKVCASTALSIAAHCMIATNHLYLAGSEEQKRKFLVPMAKGEKLGAWALTEPGAGSDALSIKTRAKKNKDGWVLNGTKCFITNGGEADVIIVIAVTDPLKFHKGFSAFIIEKDMDGFRVGNIEDKVGQRASSTAELIFEDCFVPQENLVGREGYAIFTAMECLDTERVMAGAMCTAGAEAAIDMCLQYGKLREQFGKPIVEFQNVYSVLAELATEVEASQLLWMKAAKMRDEGVRYTKEAAMAKLFASRLALKVAAETIKIYGAYGLVKDLPIEKGFRDSMLGVIGGGTSNIQKLVIARMMGIEALPW